MRFTIPIILPLFLLFASFSLKSQVTDQLYASYSFNDGTANDEVGEVDGDMSNNVMLTTDRFGNPEHAVQFVSGSHIDLDDNFDIFSTPDASFSFSFWFKRTGSGSVSQGQSFIGKSADSNCSSNQRQFSLSLFTNERVGLVFYSSLSGGGQKTITGNTTIFDTEWHHVVLNYDGSVDTNGGLDRLEIYLDNELETLSFSINNGSLGNIPNGSAHLGLGKSLSSSGGSCAHQFIGTLDDVKFYSKKLSVEEVNLLYHAENPFGGIEVQTSAYYDENENGVLDSNEGMLNQDFTIAPSSIYSLSDQNGIAHFYLTEFGTYSIAYSDNNPLWQTGQGFSTIEVPYLDSTFNDTAYYVPMVPVATFNVQKVDLTSSITRCNQETNYWLTYANRGTTINDGYVRLIADEATTFVSANPPVDSTAGDTLYWFYEDLFPTHSNQIHLVYEMPGVDAIGEMIEFEAEIESNDGIGEHKAILSSELICAYDPNDKLASPSGVEEAHYTLFEDTMDYTIRFQNTGNDTAFTVVIQDTLSEFLDLSTFRFVGSSHDVETAIDLESSIATFTFSDIYLPDSFVNETASHGFVKFEIQTVENIAENTLVENHAGIYFDLNPAIVTNTVFNTFVSELPVSGFEVPLKIYLEGPYLSDGQMAANLFGLMPFGQPYNTLPWNYDGSESLSQISGNMVDWVLVEARTGTPNISGSPGTSVVETRAGIVLANGSVVGMDGITPLRFVDLEEGESYYFSIRHRNHLDVLSAVPIVVSEEMEYDFTVDITQAFGTQQQKLSSDGTTVMVSGDINGDGVIQVTDYDIWFEHKATVNTYHSADLNLDKVIQTTDFDWWFWNKAKVGLLELQY